MGLLCKGEREGNIGDGNYFSLPVVLITVGVLVVPPIMLWFVSFRVTVLGEVPTF
jgi:hypothetical protein